MAESFEKMVARLDDIVGLLEKDDTPLDDITQLYEEGIRLARQCRKILDDTEEKVTLITNDMKKDEASP